MSEDLETILSGEDGAAEPVDAPQAAEQPQEGEVKADAEAQPGPAEEAVNTTGEEPAEEPAADVSPASEETKVEDDKLAAMQAELARIRAQNRELKEFQARQQQQPEQNPDFFDDPDKALQSLEQRFENRIRTERINMSEHNARRRYADFDNKVETFMELANQNPVLWQQMSESPDPADFAYKQADQHAKMQQFGSIDKFEEKVRAEERAKVEAAIKSEYEAKLKELSSIPESLSEARAAGGNSSPPVTNEALEDILGR